MPSSSAGQAEFSKTGARGMVKAIFPASPSPMQRVDFFRLERAIQERFVAAAEGGAPPLPLAFLPAAVPRKFYGWVALACVALFALFATARTGYGQLEHSFALQPIHAILLYVGFGVLTGFAAFAAYSTLRGRRVLPCARGVYLFPSGAIDTRGSELLVYPSSDLTSAEASERRVRVSFGGGVSFAFPAPSRASAEDVVQKLTALKERLQSGVDVREQAALDPLCDNGFRNPFSPRESMNPPRRRLPIGGFGASLLAGAVFGAAIFQIRAVLGESALYRHATAANTRGAYAAYLERGGKNPDVERILLPRAELSEILASGSIDRLEQFARAHVSSPIEPEVNAALHRELVQALAEVKKQNSLTALKQFRERFATHTSVRAEIDKAISDRLTFAAREFERRAKPKPEVAEVFRQLLNYIATHEGKVDVRFRRRIADSAAKSEEQLMKSNSFGGRASLPTQYFDAANSTERENLMSKELISTLSQAFPEDVVRFEAGPLLDNGTDDDPKLTAPTLLITHRVEMSGMYMMRRPRAALTGVGILFRVTLTVPESSAMHAYKYSAWNAPDLVMMVNGESFKNIYGSMGDKSFVRLTKRYLSELVPALAPKAPN